MLIPLKEGAVPLKNKVPYDQLQPYIISDLHEQTTPLQANQDISPDLPLSEVNPPPLSDSNPPLPSDTNPPLPSNTHTATLLDFDQEPSLHTKPELSLHTKPEPSLNIEPEPPMNIEPESPRKIKQEPPLDISPQTPVDTTPPPPLVGTLAQQPLKKRKNKEIREKTKIVFHSQANPNPHQLVLSLLQADKWLTDEHIDHGLWLMSEQYPHAKGLHSVLAFQNKQPKVESGLEDFVQILNVSGNHWVTATNVGCEGNKVKVYDSLYTKLFDKHREDLYACLASMLHTTSKNMVIEWPSMAQQIGTADCGLFALAVAISLCNGDDPGTQAYDQSVMREHLALCFECGELAAFPVKTLCCNVREKVEVTEELFCHCRMPYRKGQFMIECARCHGWFH